jgi:predicted CoA-binding protein
MKTLVLGASENPERYANKAILSLAKHGHEVVGIGAKKGMVQGVEIFSESIDFKDIDTITIYLSVSNQEKYYDYIFSLKPRRIIFNPGAENPVLADLARKKGIEVLEACTLVLLSIGNY